MTIKNAGDFTSSIAEIPVGARAYVDGPHGVFTPDRNEGPGFVLIAGGVGITPMMSILDTMADREDRRPFLLFHASRSLDDATFDDRIRASAQRLDLTLVRVLEHPPGDWTGERGFIDRAVLTRHLTQRHLRSQFFLCGPHPMVTAVHDALTAAGVPGERIHTERFHFG